jgi:hypothetical protein
MATSATADLYYLKPDPKWDVEKPYTFFAKVSKIGGASPTNIVKEAVKNVAVTDVRSKITELSMNKHGFEVIDLGQKFEPSDFYDDDWVRTIYYPSICQLVKEKLDAKEVRAYKHQLRYRHPGFGDMRLRGPDGYDPPIHQVHGDITPAYARSLFEEHWPRETEALREERLQVLNIWRPLVHTVEEWPLALCDCSSVDKERDVREADQVKKRKGSKESDNDFEVIEGYVAFHHPNHAWYYLRDQTFHEGWLIKLYDSEPGVASGVLHTAVDIGGGPVARRSCEIRMLVRI